jgi:hypothetical protein
VISVHDPDTRHVPQPTDDYKTHVAGEVDTGLITDCALRQGQRRRKPGGHWGLEWLAGRMPGSQVLTDSADGAAEARIALPEAGHRGVIKPIPQRTPVEDRFTRDDFIRRRDRRPAHLPRRRGSRCPDCSLQAELHHRTTGPPFTLHDTRPRLGAVHRTPTSRNVRFQTTYRQNPADSRTLHRLAGTGATETQRYGGTTNTIGGCTTGARGEPTAPDSPGIGLHQRRLDHPSYHQTQQQQ